MAEGCKITDEPSAKKSRESELEDELVDPVVVFLINDTHQIEAILNLPSSPLPRGLTPFHSMDNFLAFLETEVVAVAATRGLDRTKLDFTMNNRAQPGVVAAGGRPIPPLGPLINQPYLRTIYSIHNPNDVVQLTARICNWGNPAGQWSTDALQLCLSAGVMLLVNPPADGKKGTQQTIGSECWNI